MTLRRAQLFARRLAHLAALEASQWLPPELLAQRQLHHLRRVVRAASTTRLYGDRFREARVGAGDLHALEDLARFPTVERVDLMEGYPDDCVTRPLRADDVVFHTSGSSGRFLEVACSAETNAFLDAVYARALFNAGYRPWDRIAYFWWSDPIPPSLYERLGLMRKHLLRSDGDPEEQLAQLEALRPDVIYHFPSCMVAIAKRLRPGSALRPRVIVCHGELMTPESRAVIEEAFGCHVHDQYGAQEVNRIAWDCRAHRGLHVDAESVHVEILVGDRLAEPGEEGEVVLTSLRNTLMPLVRYRIGDLGRIEPRPCPCGRGLPLLTLSGGRMDDQLLLPSGRLIGPRRIVPLVERFEGFRQFRVVQTGAARVEVLLVKAPNAPPDLEHGLGDALRGLFEEELDVDVRAVDEIRLTGRGKLRCVERAFS